MSGYQLPGFGAVRGLSSGVPGSPGVAAQPWEAAKGVGQELQAVASRVGDVLMRQQRVRNVKMANEMELAANEAYAGFQNEILRNTDPATWPGLWDERLQKLKDTHLPKGLAPEQEALLGERFAEFASRTSMDIGRSAAVTEIGQARASYGNLISQAENAGDFARARLLNESGHREGLWDGPTKEAKDMELATKEVIAGVQTEAQLDPAGTKQRLREKKADGTWAHYPELPANVRSRLDGFADEAARENIYAGLERFNQGRLDGTIRTPEDIDRVLPDASATLKRRLQEDLAREVTAEQKAALKSPAVQQQMLGRLNAMIDRYRPEMSDWDSELYVMKQLADSLEESPARDEALHRLEQARKGQIQMWESKADPYRQRLKDAYAAGVFGFGSSRKAVPELVNDGLLSDESKLAAVGFRPEQIKAIAAFGSDTAEKPDAGSLEKLGVPKAVAASAAAAGGRDAQRALAGALWGKRGDAAADVDAYLFEAMKTVASGNEGFVEWPDPDKALKTDQRYGEAKAEFEGWFKQHPDASDEDFNKALQHIFSPDEQKQFDDSFFPSDELLPPIPR